MSPINNLSIKNLEDAKKVFGSISASEVQIIENFLDIKKIEFYLRDFPEIKKYLKNAPKDVFLYFCKLPYERQKTLQEVISYTPTKIIISGEENLYYFDKKNLEVDEKYLMKRKIRKDNNTGETYFSVSGLSEYIEKENITLPTPMIYKEITNKLSTLNFGRSCRTRENNCSVAEDLFFMLGGKLSGRCYDNHGPSVLHNGEIGHLLTIDINSNEIGELVGGKDKSYFSSEKRLSSASDSILYPVRCLLGIKKIK